MDKDDKIRAHKASIFLSKEANFNIPYGTISVMKCCTVIWPLFHIGHIVRFFNKLSLTFF